MHIHGVYACSYACVCALERGPGPCSSAGCFHVILPPLRCSHTSLRSNSCECVPACARSKGGGALKCISAATSCELCSCFHRISKDNGDRDDVKPPKNPPTSAHAEMQNSLCCSPGRTLCGEYRMILSVRDGTHLSL